MKPFKGNKFGKSHSDRPERSKSRSFGRPSGGSRFGRRDSEGSRDDDRPRNKTFSRSNDGDRESSGGKGGFELHQATCDKCGRECDVPFKPTGNKPVYCRSCFREINSQETGRKPDNSDRNTFRDDFKPREKSNPSSDELDKINRKLDKIMRALKIE